MILIPTYYTTPTLWWILPSNEVVKKSKIFYTQEMAQTYISKQYLYEAMKTNKLKQVQRNDLNSNIHQ